MLDYNKYIFFSFLLKIQLGEELLAAGDLEAGVEHLGQAVAVCGQTQQLLSVRVYYKLVNYLKVTVNVTVVDLITAGKVIRIYSLHMTVDHCNEINYFHFSIVAILCFLKKKLFS